MQWQICADGQTYRPICKLCDVLLNELVVRWIWGYTREDELRLYRERVLGNEAEILCDDRQQAEPPDKEQLSVLPSADSSEGGPSSHSDHQNRPSA